jgi:hypothetical protein
MDNLEQTTIGVFNYILETRKAFPYLFNANTRDGIDISMLLDYFPGTAPNFDYRVDVMEFIKNPDKKKEDIHNRLEETKKQALTYLAAFNDLSPHLVAANSLSGEHVAASIEAILDSTKTWKGDGLYLELKLKNAYNAIKRLGREGVKSDGGKTCLKCWRAYRSSTAKVIVSTEKPGTIDLLKGYIMACSTEPNPKTRLMTYKVNQNHH